VLGAAGGGRDMWKRPPMGAIAADYCDEIVLTNEDPYDEDPQAIMNEIETGISQPLREGQHLYKVLDRVEAINKAVALAQPGDVVIGTGKGSEDWIHIADDRKLPWNERAVFEAAFAKQGKK
jgi:UDP-N-acetylmuramoyl-L-alanyl-D-glutamate--2,6-diaminopimelate ligase